MPSLFTQFHYHLSSLNQDFDFASEDFNADKVYTYFYTKHQRTALQPFLDKALTSKITSLSANEKEYEELYMKMKIFADLAAKKLDK